MINFHDYSNKNKTEHNSKLPYIPDHLYRILLIGGSGSGKTNALLNLNYETKYQFLINRRESTGLIHFKSIQMMCKMFTNLLKNTMWIRNAKY